jgi:catechol 2,3-dioxygenase-like lactoylglutathione lyase family enzyme
LEREVFQSLDFIYTPVVDIDAAIDFYVGKLGAQLVWKVRDGATLVASVRVDADGPQILLANHLEGTVPILIYRVENLADTVAEMKNRGWRPDSEQFEIPHGPCITFHDPNGQRFALYEVVRPEANDFFTGRMDE